MKFTDREKVDGTSVTIGRRVVPQTKNGVRVDLALSTYSADYRDADGTRKIETLDTTLVREARRKAIEIQMRLDAGKVKPPPEQVGLLDLIDQYEKFCQDKGLSPKSLTKYRADLQKLRDFAKEQGIRTIKQFDAAAFYRFRQWLKGKKHKQGVTYADKSIYSALTLAKQTSKWAWTSRKVSEYILVGVELPTAKAKPQPCFTAAQVEGLLAASTGDDRDAFAILAFTGMRIGELEQLEAQDVLLDRGQLGMLHIRRGGSTGKTKTKEERFIPIAPRIRPIFEARVAKGGRVMPEVRERKLLAHLKSTCHALGYGQKFKLHSFRHFFASMCANNRVAYRKALAWLGHSDSSILDLYYHLHDDESEAAMLALSEKTNTR